jgi:hypothetical protein
VRLLAGAGRHGATIARIRAEPQILQVVQPLQVLHAVLTLQLTTWQLKVGQLLQVLQCIHWKPERKAVGTYAVDAVTAEVLQALQEGQCCS